MTLIGMLHHRRDPQSVVKAYAYAAVTKAEGASLIFFSPKAVDLETRTIQGYVYDNGSWKRITSPYPDVIYNTGSPIKLARSSDLIARLREEVPFTTNSIGNKMKVYGRLVRAGEFAKYLIPSEYIHSTRRFFDFITRYRKIVFKPVYGHKGQGVGFIEQVREQYHLLLGAESRVYNYDEMRSYVSARLREEPYLAQPYINCKTKTGQAYDFRMHVQKNGSGKWVITSIYPRIAPNESIVANINSGGATNYLVPFLKQEFGRDFFDVKRYLECFALQLAAHMGSLQQEHFSESIDELGIDVGLDDLGKIWIFEINWRPGCPPAFYLELDVVRHMIRYAILLAQRGLRNESL